MNKRISIRKLLALLLPALWLVPAQAVAAQLEYEVQAGVPASYVDDVQQTLARQQGRLLSELSADVERVRLRFFSDSNRFAQQTIGQTASSANGTTSRDGDTWEISLLYSGMPLSEPALRGLAQVAMQHLNPAMAEGPIWLWEAISSYQARQFVAPFRLSCITLTAVPDLDAMNQVTLAQRLGYLMGEFLFNEYGNERVTELIKRGGNLNLALERSEEQFMAHFQRYVTGRYLVTNPVPPALSGGEIRRELVDHKLFFDDGRSILLQANGTIELSAGNHVQTGEWRGRPPDQVCWQLLNFDEFCTVFRQFEGRYWLDTPADCERYPLRREQVE